ncbi:putative guanine nucleotide exchange factor-like protein [Erysiphe necator]|uniref:Guanine nucleotide-exchange factor SEC12 n=1 Tax=Uncinula necator TaxID=52586 RepID=A0A0B1PHW9_UNCNE|nr:putative guanine nucleotide exchange factor-like protein [Erysiphe necator]
MAPPIVAAKATVSIPLYTCDFDPLEPSRLVIGGGGGASRTGVGNKIIIYDASQPRDLKIVAELELSKNEDNPTSLAVGKNHLIYAGINSSPKEIEKGRNRHFRVYEIQSTDGEEKRDEDVESSELKIFERSTCSLFSGKDEDIYQRITRLATAYPEYQSQLGVVTTGLAQKHEIIIFETKGSNPPSVRDTLRIEKEAVDVDIFQIDDKNFIFAYCDENNIYTKRIGPQLENEQLQCIYKIQPPTNKMKAKISCLRSIRWLVENHIIALTNLHGNSGVTLSIIKCSLERAARRQVINFFRLPRRLKKATGLCLTNLTYENRDKVQGFTQFVLAVAGHDRSIFLFTVDAKFCAGKYIFSAITPFCTFQNVHPLQITSLAFSGICSVDSPTKSNLKPLKLCLASVGISNTVVVHTIPLIPINSPVKNGQKKSICYVVALPSRKKVKIILFGISFMAVLLISILLQGLLNKSSGTPKRLDERS